MARVRLIDIAKEAGVSVATVSYVLNNVPNQKVSDETRLKVMQIANLHNYKKNNIAEALVKGQTKCVGIYAAKYDFSIINADIYQLINMLGAKFLENGYYTIVLSSPYNTSINYIDAIVCISLSDEDFITVSKANTIPVIAVDCIRHIPWTFEICHTYKNVKDDLLLNEYVLFCYKYNSNGLNKLISQNNNNVKFVSNFLQLENLTSESANKVVVASSASLLDYLLTKNIKVYKAPFNYNNFITAIYNSTILAIEHAEVAEHVIHF